MSLYIPKMSDSPGVTIPGLAGNFETLESEAIHQSGSNNDGYYVKFGDGTLICSSGGTTSRTGFIARFDLRETTTVGIGGIGKMWHGDWVSPPVPFVGDYRIIASGGRATETSHSHLTGQANFAEMAMSVFGAIEANLSYSVVGVGRWK